MNRRPTSQRSSTSDQKAKPSKIHIQCSPGGGRSSHNITTKVIVICIYFLSLISIIDLSFICFFVFFFNHYQAKLEHSRNWLSSSFSCSIQTLNELETMFKPLLYHFKRKTNKLHPYSSSSFQPLFSNLTMPVSMRALFNGFCYLYT